MAKKTDAATPRKARSQAGEVWHQFCRNKGAMIGSAIVLVIVFMCSVYLLPGLAASMALLIYIGLILVLLNAFDITLTLPGIAGIILGIGMAVDANVIIFARVREELTEGKSVKSSLNTGFQKAMSAISQHLLRQQFFGCSAAEL